MELLTSFLLAVFIALLIGTAATFGVALIFWFVGLAVVGSLVLLLRQCWYRGMFLYHARDRMQPPPPQQKQRVIDAEFEEIED